MKSNVAGTHNDDRNLFGIFHQPEVDADDRQSDVSIDSTIELLMKV